MALHDVYSMYVIDDAPETPGEKLVYTLQMQIWRKLQKLHLDYKDKYKLPLTPAELQAFLIYWANHEFVHTSHLGATLNNINTQLLDFLNKKQIDNGNENTH